MIRIAFLSAVVAVAISAAEKPNIIFILADDLGQECVGAYGGTSCPTPNLDRLATEGVRFTRCYSQPLCTPSRVQLMTGMYNSRNYVGFGELKTGSITFGHLLSQAGYTTGITGKWQLGGGEMVPKDFGFSTWNLWQVTTRDSRYWEPGLSVDGKPAPATKGDYGPDLQQQWALNFITANKTRPFILYYPMVLPHKPLDPTPDGKKGDAAGKLERFPAMVTYLDKLVGGVAEHLRKEGIERNTLLIFTGDNGTDRGNTVTFRGQQVKGEKNRASERGTHVPLIVSWPGTAKSGVREDLVDFTDMVATFTDAAGVAKPKTCDGHSLLPAIKGTGGTGRTWVYGWYYGSDMGKTDAEWAHDGRWWVDASGQTYDIDADPAMLKPAHGAEAEAAKAKLLPVIKAMAAPSFPKVDPGKKKSGEDG
ncbi:MAG: sulfatase-like hydrolase/transferase [Planctomycetota bacterium]